MKNRNFLSFLIAVLLIAPSAFSVSKIARSVNFVDFYIGSSQPVGQRDGLPDVEFGDYVAKAEIDSDDIYKNTFHIGMTLGQLRSSHFLWSLGLHYTDHKVFDTISFNDSLGLELAYNPTYRQLDLDFNFNFYLTDLMKSSFAPYAGLGFHAGMLRIDDDVNTAEYSANLGLSVNFGADIKIWSAPDARSFVTLSSVNSYDIYGSSDRPKYLNIGGAIKYYFRP